MNRRSFLFAASAFISLVACDSRPRRDARGSADEYVSDRIRVVTRGAGPDIILIPGLAAHRDVWAAVSDQLDDQYRLHLVQLNGFAGFAPGANRGGPVVVPVAEEIARYIRAKGLDRPAVIGHSMGGTIGTMLAARHPEMVGRLMTVDIMPFVGSMFGPPGSTSESVRPIADQMRKQLLAGPPGAPSSMLEQMVSEMTRTDSMRPVLLKYARESDLQTVANSFREVIVTDLRPDLSRITAPMTVLYVIPVGLPIQPAEFERSLRQSFTNARGAHFVRIDDSGHYIQIDQPDRLVAEVAAFMSR